MSISAPVKDPDATLDYYVDWADWASPDSLSAFVVTAEGVSLGATAESAGVIMFWASGGAVGTDAAVTVEVSTDGGRIDQRTVVIPIAER